MTDVKVNNNWLMNELDEEFFPNQKVRVVSDRHGKPILEEPSGYFISASHSGGYVAVAVHDKPIGIDIEYIRSRTPDLLLFITDGPERVSLGVLEGNATLAAFTAKEAAQKSDIKIHPMQKYEILVQADDHRAFTIRRGALSWHGVWLIEKDYICALAFRD